MSSTLKMLLSVIGWVSDRADADTYTFLDSSDVLSAAPPQFLD